MRIDLVTDRRADDRGRSGGTVPGLSEETARRALVRELADRGIEAVRPGRPATGRVRAPGGAAAAREVPVAPQGRADAAAERLQDPAEPTSEALLLAGSADAMDPGTLTAWLDAARAATGGGRHVVISGLTLDDREEPAPALAELLSSACFVGLRDEVSRGVAARACPGHPALRTGWDDALLLPRHPAGARGRTEEAPRVVAALGHPAGPFGSEEAAPVLAALLDALVHRTGAAVTFVAATGTARDARFCAAVAARLPESVGYAVAAPGSAPELLLAGAEHVVTTCRDAVALALPGGSYVLPVAPDAYSERGMQTVLDRWGLVEHAVPLAALLTPGPLAWDTRTAVQQWASEAVEGRAAVRSALLDAAPDVAEASARWWDGVVEALRGGRPRNLPAPSLPPRGVGAPVARALRRRYVVPAAPATLPTETTAPAARAAVAIVLLARESPEALHRVLDGVLRQTFTDWRLVVVDAGPGGDGPESLLADRRARLAGRESVVQGRRALGAGAAVNSGLRATDSDFVLVLGGPAGAPPWPPTLLQRAVGHLEHPLGGDDGVVVRTEEPDPGDRPGAGAAPGAGPAALTLVDLLRGDRGLPGPFLYRRAVHDVLGDYDETLAGAGQWEFGLRFLETFTVGLLSGTGPVAPGRPSGVVPAEVGGDELVVRERHLKQWTAEHGVGLPLHLGRTVEEQAEALHRRLDDSEALARELLAVVRAQADRLEELERTVARRGVAAFCRRWWRALTGR